MTGIRYVLRRLARNPAFSTMSIVLLGVAFGSVACVFSVVYGLLYKPLPYTHGDRLVSVETHMLGMPFDAGLSVPFLDHIAAHARTLEAIASYRTAKLTLRDDAGGHAGSFDAVRAEPALFGLLKRAPHWAAC